jgi:hypothetical protein
VSQTVTVVMELEGALAIQRLLMASCFPVSEYAVLRAALKALTREVEKKSLAGV